MTTATAISGNATVTLSNPTLVLHDDGNVVSTTRSDTNTTININVGTAASNEELQPLIDAVALQLAQQNATADALAQIVFTGIASSDHGTSTVFLHVFKYASNEDGLVASYMLTPTPIEGQYTNLNLGTCAGAAQTDLDTFAAISVGSLQSGADTAAQAARTIADAQVGISDLSGTGEASLTLTA